MRFQCCRGSRPRAESGFDERHLRSFDAVWISSVEEERPCEHTVNVCTRSLACSYDDEEKQASLGPMSTAERSKYRDAARAMFDRAYDDYMSRAFPSPELKPVSCQGGDFGAAKLPAMTLIDTLDTLALMKNESEFRRGVELVSAIYSVSDGFDLDVNVSVFETNIRVLGGLLAAHGFADYDDYDGSLLNLAVDLGNRLLPAFETKSGIPYGTVNLMYGVPHGETSAASLAGGGSLSLEMSVLSAYTGDARYGEKATAASRELYRRRSRTTGLVGKHINVQTGKWIESLSGIGSNSDSFYEYMAKMYSLFGDLESWNMFVDLYQAIMSHSKRGDWYADVDMYTGKSRRHHFENLQAFWPGVQAMAGDVRKAARTLNAMYIVADDWAGLPEDYDFNSMQLFKSSAKSLRSLLRPELLESTYILHRLTRDSSWLWAAANMLEAIEAVNKAPCGYASLKSTVTQTLDDEMPSFFLAETLKYLYLIFEQDNIVDLGDYVFSTEAHLFSSSAVRRAATLNFGFQNRTTAASQSSSSPEGNETAPTDAPYPSTPQSPFTFLNSQSSSPSFSDGGSSTASEDSIVQKGRNLWRRFIPVPTMTSPIQQTDDKRQSTESSVGILEGYSARARSRRCVRPEWWEAFGFQADFEDKVTNDDADRTAPEERSFLSTAFDRFRCLERPQKSAVVVEDESVSSKEKQGETDLHPGQTHILSTLDMGDFHITMFEEGGITVRNDEDGDVVEISSTGSSSPMSLISSTVDGETHLATIDSEGLEVACLLAVSDVEYGCTVAAFGRAAALADHEVGESLLISDVSLTLPSQLEDDRGCSESENIEGGIIVVHRGACLFEQKARVAQQRAADAIIVINSVPGRHRFVMANASVDSANSEENERLEKAQVEIPAAMISSDDGALLEALASDSRATLRIFKRPIPPESPLQLLADETTFQLAGRGRWGIRIVWKTDKKFDLIIIDVDDELRENMAARAAGMLCDIPSTATYEAYVETSSSCEPLDHSQDFFPATTHARRCACHVDDLCVFDRDTHVEERICAACDEDFNQVDAFSI